VSTCPNKNRPQDLSALQRSRRATRLDCSILSSEKAVPEKRMIPLRGELTLNARRTRQPSDSIANMARHTAIFALAVRSRAPRHASPPHRYRS
jgi:hypothetical protein